MSEDKKSNVSVDKIEKFVDDMLANKNVNIKYLPDAIEKQMYVNMFTILLGVLENVAESTTIEFMGHKLKISVVKD